jgi:hypothetical protein
MAQNTSFQRFVKFLSRFLGVSALATWFGFIGLFYHYDATRPTVPQPSEGRTYPSNNHGHIVYLSEHDKNQLQLLQVIAFCLVVPGILLEYAQRQRLTVKQVRNSALSVLQAILTPTRWLDWFGRLRQQGARSSTASETNTCSADSISRRHAISIYTAKDISECQRAVRSVGYSAFGVVLASFDGYKFRLYVQRNYRNSFAPIFSGRLIPQVNGTRVEGRFGMHPFVKIFLAVWFGGVAIIGGLIFIRSIGQALSVYTSDNQHTLIGFAVPLILLFFGILLVRFGKQLGRNEETLILNWLKRSFANSNENSAPNDYLGSG